MHDHYFKAFMHTLTYIRNLCAHHARLWNRKLVIKPLVFKRQKEMGLSNERMAAQFVILYDMLHVVAPNNHWADRLRDLLQKHNPDLEAMGFEGLSLEEFFLRLRK